MRQFRTWWACSATAALALGVLVAASCSRHAAEPIRAAPAPSLASERHRLANGLELVLAPDRRVPFISVVSAYRVGSKDDPPGRSGLAHLHEHLVVAGALPRAAGEAIPLSNLAGNTRRDTTRYMVELPPEHLALAFWLEAARLSLFDRAQDEPLDARLAAAKTSLVNERFQKVDNGPLRALALLVPRLAHPPGHPYANDGWGEIPDVEATSLAELEAFHRRHYRPSRAVMTLVGDFDPDEAKALAARYLGTVPEPAGSDESPAAPPPEGPSAGARPTAAPWIVEAAVEHPAVLLLHRAPPLWGPDDAELSVLSSWLADETVGLLRDRLVRRRGVASRVWAWHERARLGGFLEISVYGHPGGATAELLAAVQQELGALQAAPPSEAAVAVAKARMLAREGEGETLQDRAHALADGVIFAGATDAAERFSARRQAVTPAALWGAQRRWLDPARRTVILIEPRGDAPIAGRLRQGAPPAARSSAGDPPLPSRPGPVGARRPVPLGPPPSLPPARHAVVDPPAQSFDGGGLGADRGGRAPVPPRAVSSGQRRARRGGGRRRWRAPARARGEARRLAPSTGRAARRPRGRSGQAGPARPATCPGHEARRPALRGLAAERSRRRRGQRAARARPAGRAQGDVAHPGARV